MTELSARRLLLVHAHPDDETIGTGATMARYAAEGAQVTLITCTRGEEGEIVVPDLAHLASARDDELGAHRVAELAAACAAMGVTDHRFLGGEGRYRDSGMLGTPENDAPGSFWQAPLAAPVRDLVALLREVRPQVVVTYNEFGGYGHPDHVRANQVTVAAIDAAADAGYFPELGAVHAVDKLYYSVISKGFLQRGIDALKAAGQQSFFGADSADDLPFGVPDDHVTTRVDASAYVAAKFAALRAHATQVSVDGPFFALSNGLGRGVMGLEEFVLARGATGPLGEDGAEEDLFAGLPLGR